MPSPRLLVVDDEPDLRTLYELTLLREGYDVDSAGGVEEAWSLLQARGPGRYQLVITDMRLPDGSGLDLLRRIDDGGRHEKAVVITAYGSPENAVEALKAGAYDYLTKPVDLRQFRAAVASALGRSPLARPAVSGQADIELPAVPTHPALERIVGQSPGMQQVRSLVQKVARSMAPVLVQGESGTGKELVARAIHDCSPRGAGPFVAVNCGAIPETLLEAEFFGYRKGAFTGANTDREGFFQAAQGGTLFLDEIGELQRADQAKLLRVLQDQSYQPVGASRTERADVRVVSATNRELTELVATGAFREDLFYRINLITLRLPPLRERRSDIPLLAHAIVAQVARNYRLGEPTLTPQALQWLGAQPWPGNVRQLGQTLERTLLLSGKPQIGQADLVAIEQADGSVGGGPLGVDGLTLEQVECLMVSRAMEQHAGNVSQAARALGLSRTALYRRLQRHGLDGGLAADESSA